MENRNINQDLIQVMSQLLEKTAVESFAPVSIDAASDLQDAEAMLVSLKAINARYDKSDAIAQVQGLMKKYNIQIDELMEQIKY